MPASKRRIRADRVAEVPLGGFESGCWRFRPTSEARFVILVHAYLGREWQSDSLARLGDSFDSDGEDDDDKFFNPARGALASRCARPRARAPGSPIGSRTSPDAAASAYLARRLELAARAVLRAHARGGCRARMLAAAFAGFAGRGRGPTNRLTR
jgi:hypothetical protein